MREARFGQRFLRLQGPDRMRNEITASMELAECVRHSKVKEKMTETRESALWREWKFVAGRCFNENALTPLPPQIPSIPLQPKCGRSDSFEQGALLKGGGRGNKNLSQVRGNWANCLHETPNRSRRSALYLCRGLGHVHDVWRN